jgi:uncharacterized SAM-binding protein YcdF (DUF218 family)
MNVYRFVTELLQPFTLAWLLTAAALLFWRRRTVGRRWLLFALPFAALTVVSLPATSHLALGTLERPFPPLENVPPEAEALVVLGGGVFPADGTRPQPELAPDSVYRCLRAAELYRQRRLPVLVSGGEADPNGPWPAVAPPMRDFLITLGVRPEDLIVEDASRTTYENAVACQRLLAERGLNRVVLVTDAHHLWRSVACFRRQGIVVVSAGCRYRATRFEWSVFAFVPVPWAAENFQLAAHEWLGGLWYWVRGRI